MHLASMTDPCAQATAAVRLLGADPQYCDSPPRSVDTYQRHLAWDACAARWALLAPPQPVWVLHMTERDYRDGVLDETLPEFSRGPVSALGRALQVIDTGRLVVDAFDWLPNGGWQMSHAGARVAQASPMRFKPVADELKLRCQGALRRLTRGELARCLARMRELPALSQCQLDAAHVAEVSRPRPDASAMLTFEPSAAVRHFVRYAGEFGVSLSASRARQVLAEMWGFGSWHALSARWKSLAAPEPYLLRVDDEAVDWAPDAAGGLALLEQYARRRSTAWCASQFLEISQFGNYAPSFELYGSPHASRQDLTQFGMPSAEATPMSEAECPDAYHRLAEALWSEDRAACGRGIVQALALGQPRRRALENAERRLGLPLSFEYRNLRFARTEDTEGDYSRFSIVAYDRTGQPVRWPAGLNSRHHHFFVEDALYKANLHYDDGTFWVMANYGRHRVCRLENVPKADARALATWFGRPPSVRCAPGAFGQRGLASRLSASRPPCDPSRGRSGRAADRSS